MYKLQRNGYVMRLADLTSIPPDERNADYRRYLEDVANGAEVLPADPPPPVPPAPDYGPDAPDDYAWGLPSAVTLLRAYLALDTPTAAQSTAALKIVIRCVLYLARRYVQ